MHAENIDVTKATTDGGKKVEVSGPATPDAALLDDTESLGAYTREEIEDLLGDLEPGETGYLPLDEEGYVSGPAIKGAVPEGVHGAPVVATQDTRPMALTTPSGAPIAKRMNESSAIGKENKVDSKRT